MGQLEDALADLAAVRSNTVNITADISRLGARIGSLQDQVALLQVELAGLLSPETQAKLDALSTGLHDLKVETDALAAITPEEPTVPTV